MTDVKPPHAVIKNDVKPLRAVIKVSITLTSTEDESQTADYGHEIVLFPIVPSIFVSQISGVIKGTAEKFVPPVIQMITRYSDGMSLADIQARIDSEIVEQWNLG